MRPVSRPTRADGLTSILVKSRGFTSRQLPRPGLTYYVLQYNGVEIHRSARRHGVSDEDIEHAILRGLVFDLEPDADPPKFLCVGPNRAGLLLEVIWVEFADDRMLVIHAMALRPTFYDLLSDEEEDL